MAKFEIRQIDAWTEAEGGWTWNDSIKIGEFKTNATDEKRAFLYALHKLGIVCKRGRMAVINDGNIFELQDRRTKEPLYAAIPC
ncbi:hypothetical protein [Flintibacter muris]|uniref:hypothetical protein n=1 Tax=Flintibacter muris TaxID=2941327 RepID=UPI0020420CB5|nr:hypothetical protein [Flintibacter muris]